MNVTKYRNRRLASRNMKHLRGLKFKGKISQCEMHLVACSCSAGTLARLFPCLFFLGPGERVGTMQLGSLGGQGLPCRLPRCLFSGHINRKQPAPPSLHFVVLGVVVVVVVVCRSCDCVATNAVPPESYDPSRFSLYARSLSRYSRCLCASCVGHTRILAVVYARRHYPCEIEPPPRFPRRSYRKHFRLQRRESVAAWEKPRSSPQ